MTLKDIAESINARIRGDTEIEITGASGIDEAGEGEITYVAEKRLIDKIFSTGASAIILSEDLLKEAQSRGQIRQGILIVRNPKLAFARVLEILYLSPYQPKGISNRAYIGQNVTLGRDITISAFAYIEDDAVIGDRVVISPYVYIGKGTVIENDTYIYPHVTVREGVKIGKRVIIHPGAVIGSDGFGFVSDEGRHHKIPQVGGVIIEDDVEIGSNVSIDRATTGNTIIGKGTKIDNLVQIGHNVKIGKNCIIVAQVGIGGSAQLGDGVIVAGQVGIRDHIKIGNRVMIGAQAGVGSDVPDGQTLLGSPAIDHKKWLRAHGIFTRLPEILKKINEIERKIQKED